MRTMDLYANLHLHTVHSDGKYTPEEIVAVAKEEGYKAVAVTDHDTATAYPELVVACEKAEMECIFGAEFSVLKPKDYHITAYHFDPEYPPMKQYLADMGSRITDNTKHCFDEAVENGNISGITWEEVLEYNRGIAWLCNDHVFEAMLDKGLVERSEYMEWFETNFSKQRKKYPPIKDFLELREMIKLIHDAGGIALVAHPSGQLDDIDMLIECGIDGMEVLHPCLDDDERNRAILIALEKDLYISGGSDHSGLCGGCYSGFASEEALKNDPLYIPEMSAGTVFEFYEEIKKRTLNREYREKLKGILKTQRYTDYMKK